MSLMENFERNMLLMLKEKGISQAELSKRIGVGKSTVNDWVHKHKEPSISNVYKIMKELNCTFEELVE